MRHALTEAHGWLSCREIVSLVPHWPEAWKGLKGATVVACQLKEIVASHSPKKPATLSPQFARVCQYPDKEVGEDIRSFIYSVNIHSYLLVPGAE